MTINEKYIIWGAYFALIIIGCPVCAFACMIVAIILDLAVFNVKLKEDSKKQNHE